jgi:RNA polymerase sigma factor (sigma-70 family)
MATSPGSVTRDVGAIADGRDPTGTAAKRIDDRYRERAVGFAAKRHGRRCTIGDEEDAVQEALGQFFLKIRSGLRIENRAHFERLLFKAIDWAVKKQKRKPMGHQLNDDALRRIPDQGPSPDERAIAGEMVQEFFARLDSCDGSQPKEVLRLWLTGCTQKKIASKLGCSLASVERRFAVIRGVLREMGVIPSDDAS